MFLLGCLSFALFFLADYNDARLHKRFLAPCFSAGVVLLGVSVIFQLKFENAPVSGTMGRILLLLLFAVFMGLLICTLFFSFPAGQAYVSPGKKRPVYDSGFYALCRHPGLIWLTFVFFCLWLMGGFPFYSAVIYTLLNLALVLFEDGYAFPIILTGYEAYKKVTPFLIPTPGSIKNALGKKRTESVSGQ